MAAALSLRQVSADLPTFTISRCKSYSALIYHSYPTHNTTKAMERAYNVGSVNARETLTKNSRRRSLKTLFQLPLSTRSSTYGSVSTTASVGSIPADIVREIVDLLAPSDILNFSLTVRIHSILISLMEWQEEGNPDEDPAIFLLLI